MSFRITEKPWDDLGLVDLEAFLADAGEEGVTWEAKADEGTEGGKQLHPGRIRAAVNGLANQIGGSVLIGAARTDGRWTLPGIIVPTDEPELWLDQVLEGLRPQPRSRHKAWQLDDGRVAALIEVEPLTLTPCITRDGQVFERVSSETKKVTDPARLHELFQRGREAQALAHGHAAQLIEGLFEQSEIVSDRSVWVAVALRAAAYDDADIGGRLFTEHARQALVKSFGERLFGELSIPAPKEFAWDVRQNYIEFAGGHPNNFWVARADWSGAVGCVAALGADGVNHLSLLDFVIVPAWKLAADLVAALGGYGDAAVQITVLVRDGKGWERVKLLTVHPQRLGEPPHGTTMYSKMPARTDLTRWSQVSEPSEAEIGSVQREIKRSARLWAPEGLPKDAV